VSKTEELRDRNGNMLGKIQHVNDSRVELRDRNGNLKGYYNPKQKETLDRNGNQVAH
jgi:hypothetical protein